MASGGRREALDLIQQRARQTAAEEATDRPRPQPGIAVRDPEPERPLDEGA
jgi:hypothetical protein